MERGTVGKKLEGTDLLKKVEFKKRGEKKYYRVTSVLGVVNPPKYQVPEDELLQYAARGTLLHADASEMLGGVVNLKERREALKTLLNGNLKLEQIKKQTLKDFMLKYPEYNWKNPMAIEKTLWDDGLQLVGTLDVSLQRKDGKLCLCDWKSTQNYPQEVLRKFFKQLGAYALMWERSGKEKIDELHIFPMKPKNRYGYGAPYITKEVQHYQQEFIKDYLTLNPNIKWETHHGSTQKTS